jgi:citrate lyase subunit beta/citryl-CoA lyase
MTEAGKPRRSVLYMPASNPRAVQKARELPADGVILDLEDSVAPDMKEKARADAAAAVRAGGFGRRELVIRVNALDSAWGMADLSDAALAGPGAILVPKVDDPATVTRASALLAEAGAPAATRLWIMMETPRAILAAHEIARAGGRLACFVLGTNDLLKELRAAPRPDRLALQTSLSLALLAARAEGLVILDGVYNAIADLAGFEAECRAGRDLGFDGKTLIHPSQVAPCNRIFPPEPDAVAWARRVIAAFAAPDARAKGVLQIDGRMAERLHVAEARRLVAIADAIAAMEAAGD